MHCFQCKVTKVQGVSAFNADSLWNGQTGNYAGMGMNNKNEFLHVGDKGVESWWGCLSYDATWQCLRQLIHEAGYLDMIREGHWIWIYDNLNFSQKVRHERSGLCARKNTYTWYNNIMHSCIMDTHPGMMNVTSR